LTQRSVTLLLPAFFYPLNTPLQEFLQYVPASFHVPWFGVTSDANDCAQFFTFSDSDGSAGNLLASTALRNSHARQHSAATVPHVRFLGAADRRVRRRSVLGLGCAERTACRGSAASTMSRRSTRAATARTDYLNSLPITQRARSAGHVPAARRPGLRSSASTRRTTTRATLRFTFAVNDHPINVYHRSNNFTRLDIGTDTPFAQVLKKDQMIVTFAQMATIDMITRAFAHQLDPTYLPNKPDLVRASNTKFGGRMPRADSIDFVLILHAFGVMLYPIALSLQLPIYIYLLVLEKAEKLRNHMFAHGMRLMPYYLTTFLFNLIMSLLAMAALWIAGAVAQIEIFSLTSPLLLIVFFIGWGLLLVAFAFVLSTVILTPRAASVIGYVVALFGSLLAVIVAAVMYGNLPLIGNGMRLPLYLYIIPQFTMTRGIYLMNDRCSTWHECYNGLPGADDELAVVLAALYLSAAAYFVLGLALDGGLARLATLRVKRVKKMGARSGSASPLLSLNHASARDDDDHDNNGGGGDVQEENLAASSELVHLHRPPLGAAPPVLDIDHLSKKYSGAKTFAVKDLSFAIGEQQIFALTGANGAGKTSLLSMLTGALTPTAGDARVCGHSILSDMRGVQQNIGVCTQFDVLWSELTVEETLLFYARLKGVARKHEREHVSRLLRELGLSDARNRKPAQLSGGMRRRLSIGVALSGGSRFVVLDEATTGVDIVSRANIWQIIERAKRRRRSILLTTHAFEEAEKLADLVAIMHKGELRALGTLDQLVESAGSHYVLRVAYNRADVEAVRRDIAAMAPHAIVVRLFESVGTWEIAKRDASGATWRFSRLFAALRANERVLDFSLSDVGLTQVFESIVQEKSENHK
jgi:ABC-type multidrug transport system ATPase subunit